jgi:hypothetical protein
MNSACAPPPPAVLFPGLLDLLPLISAALAGCQTLNAPPKVDVAEPTAALPVAHAAPVINNGAIFQAAQYRPLFEDHRARLVGDTLTVQIVEKVSASQKSTSSIDKSGKLSAGVTALPFGIGQLLRPRQRRRHLEQHLRGQGQHREHQRLLRHHHRDGDAACCPTATCWWPARSRSA